MFGVAVDVGDGDGYSCGARLVIGVLVGVGIDVGVDVDDGFGVMTVWCSDGDIHNVDYDIPRTCWSCLNPRMLKAFIVNGALPQWMGGEHMLRF